MSRSIEIHPAHYRTSTLTVAPKFVAPGPDELNRIKDEIALKNKVFAASATEPLWSGNFVAPVHATPTDSFGTRRTVQRQTRQCAQGDGFSRSRGHAGKGKQSAG